jgi:serine phosphatase RsbU (regulator of sigma subunit)
MWVFSEHKRDFGAEQTGMLEVVSGRIAAELERAVLLRETAQVKRPDFDSQRMLRWQRSRLPQIEPMLDGWDLAGWTPQLERVGGEFFDWSVLNNGDLTLAVGAADGLPVEASLTAAAMHSALRSHAFTAQDSKQLLTRMNDTFWTSSSGDQTGSLACAMLSPETCELHFSATGRTGGLIVASRKTKLILPATPALGLDPDASFSMNRRTMTRGSLAVLFSLPTDRHAHEAASSPIVQIISEKVKTCRTATAAQVVEAIRAEIRNLASVTAGEGSLLVLKRTL